MRIAAVLTLLLAAACSESPCPDGFDLDEGERCVRWRPLADLPIEYAHTGSLERLDTGEVVSWSSASGIWIYAPEQNRWRELAPPFEDFQQITPVPGGGLAAIEARPDQPSRISVHAAQAGAWTEPLDLPFDPYSSFSVTALLDGTVLLIGVHPDDHQRGLAVVFHPTSRQLVETGEPDMPHTDHAALRLESGKVMVLGGWARGEPSKAVRLYDPESGGWSAGPDLITAYNRPVALQLGGMVVVAGHIAGGDYSTWSMTRLVQDTWFPLGPLRENVSSMSLVAFDSLRLFARADGQNELFDHSFSATLGEPRVYEVRPDASVALVGLDQGRLMAKLGRHAWVFEIAPGY